MGVVTGSLMEVVTGDASPRLGLSLGSYVDAFSFIQGFPNRIPAAGWLLLCAAVLVAVRHRRDPTLLTLLLVPQALAILGYALFQGGLDHYYYLSLMPAAVLTVVLGIAALPERWPLARNALAMVMCAAVLTGVPGRLALLGDAPSDAGVRPARRRLAACGSAAAADEGD